MSAKTPVPPPSARQVADFFGFTPMYGWEVISGRKVLADAKAARAWTEKRWKLGRVKPLSDRDADGFARAHGAKAET